MLKTFGLPAKWGLLSAEHPSLVPTRMISNDPFNISTPSSHYVKIETQTILALITRVIRAIVNRLEWQRVHKNPPHVWVNTSIERAGNCRFYPKDVTC